MPEAEVPQSPSPLLTWDWRAELAAQDRPLTWLAKRSGVPYQTIWRVSQQLQQPTDAQLRAFARALGVAGPDGADL